MDSARPRLQRSGSFAMAMAFAALVLQLLFPPGFMAGTAGQAAHGVPIVICTAEGRVTVNWEGAVDHESKKAPAKPMAACPFAGHAIANAPPTPQAHAEPVAFAHFVETTRAYVVFPGRGLAAPPPPAIGPPVQV
jgi:hypothetical protein